MNLMNSNFSPELHQETSGHLANLDSVDLVLDAGALARSKTPDLFWSLDINSRELSILQFLWRQSLNLRSSNDFTASKSVFETIDQLSRTLQIQEPKLIKSLNNLKNLGIIYTSDRPLWNFGFSQKYFSDLGIHSGEYDVNSREYTSFLIEEVLSKLYSLNVVELVRMEIGKQWTKENSVQDYQCSWSTLLSQPKFPFPKTSKDFIEHTQVVSWNIDSSFVPTLIFSSTPSGWSISDDHVRAPKVKRKSIKIKRTPIKVSSSTSNLTRKIEILSNPKNKEIINDLGEYISQKWCKITHQTKMWDYDKPSEYGGRHPRILIFQIHEMCLKEGWNPKIFIDAQLANIEFWTKQVHKKLPAPPLASFLLPKAKKIYLKFLDDSRRFSITGDEIKLKVSETKSLYQEVYDTLENDCKTMAEFLNTFRIKSQYRMFWALPDEKAKCAFMAFHPTLFSAYFWATVPWLKICLEGNSTLKRDLLDVARQYRKDPEFLIYLLDTVGSLEEKYNIPESVDDAHKLNFPADKQKSFDFLMEHRTLFRTGLEKPYQNLLGSDALIRYKDEQERRLAIKHWKSRLNGGENNAGKNFESEPLSKSVGTPFSTGSINSSNSGYSRSTPISGATDKELRNQNRTQTGNQSTHIGGSSMDKTSSKTNQKENLSPELQRSNAQRQTNTRDEVDLVLHRGYLSFAEQSVINYLLAPHTKSGDVDFEQLIGDYGNSFIAFPEFDPQNRPVETISSDFKPVELTQENKSLRDRQLPVVESLQEEFDELNSEGSSDILTWDHPETLLERKLKTLIKTSQIMGIELSYQYAPIAGFDREYVPDSGDSLKKDLQSGKITEDQYAGLSHRLLQKTKTDQFFQLKNAIESERN